MPRPERAKKELQKFSMRMNLEPAFNQLKNAERNFGPEIALEVISDRDIILTDRIRTDRIQNDRIQRRKSRSKT